jgi:hypothetical protein
MPEAFIISLSLFGFFEICPCIEGKWWARSNRLNVLFMPKNREAGYWTLAQYRELRVATLFTHHFAQMITELSKRNFDSLPAHSPGV